MTVVSFYVTWLSCDENVNISFHPKVKLTTTVVTFLWAFFLKKAYCSHVSNQNFLHKQWFILSFSPFVTWCTKENVKQFLVLKIQFIFINEKKLLLDNKRKRKFDENQAQLNFHGSYDCLFWCLTLTDKRVMTFNFEVGSGSNAGGIIFLFQEEKCQNIWVHFVHPDIWEEVCHLIIYRSSIGRSYMSCINCLNDLRLDWERLLETLERIMKRMMTAIKRMVRKYTLYTNVG